MANENSGCCNVVVPIVQEEKIFSFHEFCDIKTSVNRISGTGMPCDAKSDLPWEQLTHASEHIEQLQPKSHPLTFLAVAAMKEWALFPGKDLRGISLSNETNPFLSLEAMNITQ